MDIDRQEVYTNKHRALLQSFLAYGTLTFEAARPVLAAIISADEDVEILENDVTESDFNTYISVINAEVSRFDLEIRSAYTQLGQRTKIGRDGPSRSDVSRVRVFAMVNTTSDAVSQLATTRPPEELAYLGRIIDDMFDKYNHESGKEIMAIPHNQAVRLNKAGQSQRSQRQSLGGETQANGQGLTMKQAEATLKSFVEEGWLEPTGSARDPYYVLTPRALAELKGWLMDTYNEPGDPSAPSDDDEDEQDDSLPGRRGIEKIKLCAACNEIVISGQRCRDKRCRARLHDACTGAMWRSQRGAAVCPKCKQPWEGHGVVGVRAAGVSLDSSRQGRASSRRSNVGLAEADTSFSTRTAGHSSRRSSRAASEVGEDEEDE